MMKRISNSRPKGVCALLKWGESPKPDVLKAILENPCIDGIRNGIGYGADFLELYMKDIQNEGYQDLIAQASIFLNGRLSFKEVAEKCKCLQAMKK